MNDIAKYIINFAANELSFAMVTMAEIAGDVAVNPDAQAAVTDFLDYTEYLPADLIRSLTLIRSLDESYLTNAQDVHDLTRVYGSLPSLPATSRPNAQDLRSDISRHLDQALSARESAYAEACRLFDLTDRHQNRLQSIIAKLHGLPKPPSRDPTPQPQPVSSAKRSRSGRKIENGMSGTRLTLKAPKGPTLSILSRPRHRRVTVPGEVMPPFDPDEPIASTEVSDWESDPPSPVRPVLKLKQPKAIKAVVQSVEKEVRKPRETATYRKPTPPPEDADIGSKYRPWTHLTEYEMYKLRKKMKKNHTWEPSEVMIRRELAEKGRGWDNYYKAKADAHKNGTKFIDIDQDKDQSEPADQVETPKVTPTTAAPPSTITSKGKSSKKPDLKKEKKEESVQSRAALAAQEAELAARRLGDIGSAFKNLFSPFANALSSLNRSASTPTANNSTPTGKKPTGTEKTQRKRKLDESSVSTSPSVEPEGQRKKQKTAPPKAVATASSAVPAEMSSAGTIKIPLKLTVNTQASPVSESSTPISTTASTTRAVSVQRSSIAPRAEQTPQPSSRPPSRRSTAASAEPQAAVLSAPALVPATALVSRPSRRASTTPGPVAATMRKTPVAEGTPKTVPTAASRRSKRDAPGTVTQSSQDGGAAVSVSKRKSKPSRSNKATVTPKATVDTAVPQIRIDIDGNQEIVDPDEERYCVCHDVSWGEMICCELDDKASELKPARTSETR